MAVQGSSSPIVDATTQTEEHGECVPYAACPHASACPSILFSDSSAAMQQDGHPATSRVRAREFGGLGCSCTQDSIYFGLKVPI